MTTTKTSTRDAYRGPAGEIYERHFTPAIGEPSARPVIDAAGLRSGNRVLDVGCGTGIAARLAAERVSPEGLVAGVDPNPGALEVARRSAVDVPAEWREGVAEKLPFGDESFDAVVSSLSFQFFADKAAALREAHRVLAPGGRVAVGTPGPIPAPMVALDEVLTEHIGPQAGGFVGAVFSVDDPGEVRDLMMGAGFDDVDARRIPLPLRVPPPADFLWAYVYATPLGGLVSNLDDEACVALERSVVARWEPFVDDEGALVFDPQLVVATARKETA